MKTSLRRDATTKGKNRYPFHSKIKKDNKVNSRRQLRRVHKSELEADESNNEAGDKEVN